MSIRPGVRPSWLTQALFPYESRFVELDGHVVHYVDEGRGPTLLLLHGNPTWSFLYRHLIAGLRGQFRCVALDYPGFGLSVAASGYDCLPSSHERVVELFADKLELRRITPVVQDWGGPIGLGFAGRCPERIRALVIGNTWAWPVDDDPHFVRFSSLMGGSVGGFAIRNFNAFVNLMIPLGTARRSLSSQEMKAYRLPMDRTRRSASHIFPRSIVACTPYLREVASSIPAIADRPALICWGDKDFAFRSQERARFEATFRRARTVILEGASHYIQEDAPEAIISAILAWWPEHAEGNS